MILVTGATGLNGTELLKRLSAKGIPTRALVRNRAKATAIASLPQVEIAEGDMLKPETLKPAALSEGMPSGGGTSIQSTWPERSAANSGCKELSSIHNWGHYRSPTPDKRHLRCHHGHELHVGFKRQARHIEHRMGYMFQIHSRLHHGRTVRLRNARGHSFR